MQDANLTIRIPSDLKAQLQSRADAQERTLTQIVVKALSVAARKWPQAQASTEKSK